MNIDLSPGARLAKEQIWWEHTNGKDASSMDIPQSEQPGPHAEGPPPPPPLWGPGGEGPAEGPGGERGDRLGSGHPQNTIQRPDRLYKASKHYTKTQNMR